MIKCSITIIFILLTENIVEPTITESILQLIFGKNDHIHDIRRNISPVALIDHYGYSGEKHLVETSDGYILTLHRISGKKSNPNPQGKPTVYIQHGILGSSIGWIDAGPNRSLAFMLADLGMDVWLGNSRGNKYSQAHVNLKPSEKAFWDFSYHEIGIFDLPATIDYILAKTGNKKLAYVGHSQGTTVSYVLLSERPKYNNKISSLISLAPVAYGLPESSFSEAIAEFTKLIHLQQLYNFIHFYEIPAISEPFKTIVLYVCNKNSFASGLCKDLITFISGTSDLYDYDQYPIFLQYFPAGSSTKQFVHYAQQGNIERFQQFDYGEEGNKERYGSVDPPKYKLENVKVPTTFFIGNTDVIASAKDVMEIYKRIANQNGFIIVPHPQFAHLDFTWGIGVKCLVYENVSSILNNN